MKEKTKLKDRLISERKRTGISMTDVARRSKLIAKANRQRRMEITQGYISRLESGKETNPSMLKIMTLCLIYWILPNKIIRIEEVKSA